MQVELQDAEKRIKHGHGLGQNSVADPRGGGGRNRRPLKFDQLCFLSNFVSECLKIRLR